MNEESTVVAIVGGGVSGLALATFLRKSGVACIILERRNRAYLEARQRAGFIESRAVEMFERWGLASKLLEGPSAPDGELRIHGSRHAFGGEHEGQPPGRFCTQQQIVINLLRELIDEMKGDVRFEVADITIRNDEGARPRISYADAHGKHDLVCNYVVGCDGGHSVSRSSIPHDVLTKYSYEFGYAWLAALVEVPANPQAIMSISEYGFAAQITRGPRQSRVYLQCDASDGPEDWPDERIWAELRRRLNAESLENGPVLDKDVIPLRSVVFEPMQYRNLFLVGDAAHLLPPTAAKGMNLALHDVDLLSQALARAIRDGDKTGLQNYSETALPHVWEEQEISTSMTDIMHDAGDCKQHGTFRKRIALKRLEMWLGGARYGEA